MKLAETSILSINQNNSIFHFSIVQKQSQSGLIFHERLLILTEQQNLGYISKFEMKDDPQKVDPKKVKLSVPIKYIKAIDHDRENLIIKFVQIQKGKQENKRWAFKMASAKMVQDWHRLLQDQKAKRASRSQERKSKGRRTSQNLSPLKGQKNEEKIKPQQQPKVQQKSLEQEPNPFQNESQAQQDRRGSPKKQASKPNQSPSKIINNPPARVIEEEQSQNREFVNPLYTGYDSRDSEITKNVVKRNDAKELEKRKPQITPDKVQKKLPSEDLRISNQVQAMKKPVQSLDMKPDAPKHKQPQRLQLIEPLVGKNKLQLKIDQKQNYPKPQIKALTPSNNQFEKSPKTSYIEMIEKIVRDSEQKTVNKYKALELENPSGKGYYNAVLEEFLRYEEGQTEKWKRQNLRKDVYEELNLEKGLEREPLRQSELQEMQRVALDLQQQSKKRIQQLKSVNLTSPSSFSTQIALMIRNKRFQRQGHEELQSQQTQKKFNIKNAPFSYRYIQATSPYLKDEEKQEDLMEVTNDWRLYCEQLMKDLIKDIVKGEGRFKLKAKKANCWSYEVDEVHIKVALAGTKVAVIHSKEDKANKEKGAQNKKRQEKVSQYSAGKDLQIQFKNYSTINELIQKVSQRSPSLQNSFSTPSYSSRLKVPLISLVQYCGFIALFKLNPKFSYKPTDINEQYIKEKQVQVTKMFNIEVKWLEDRNKNIFGSTADQSKSLLLHVDENYYAQLHVQRMETKAMKLTDSMNKSRVNNAKENKLIEARKLFDIDFLQEIDHFLLRDYLTKSVANGVLRKQLIQQMTERQEYSKTIFSPNITAQNPTKKSKMQADLTLLSGQILQKLSRVILKLDNLEFYYLHPEELSQFLHSEGINMRYIGLAFDNLTETYPKKFLMTEIAARVVKLLLRKTIQDVLFEAQEAKQSESLLKKGQINIVDEVSDFLNCVLGSSYQSTMLWKMFELHAQYYFKCPLNKNTIDRAYFINSLAYHCKLNVDWKKISGFSTIFNTETFFNPQNLLGVRTKSKTIEPFLSKKYQTLSSLLDKQKISNNPSQSEQTFGKIIELLELSKNPFPEYLLPAFSSSSPLSILSLKQFLCQFVRPETIKLSSNDSSFGHLRVFNDLNQFPQKRSINIKISQIKWYLRLKKKDKYLKKFQELINMLTTLCGDFSPILSQVYDIFANFHLSNGQFQDAITFAKSSLVNVLKICGTNHVKTAQAYYNLSLCYLKADKIQDAYNLLKKSKTIYEAKQKISTQAYAVISLKLGLLMLNKNQINQSINALKKALQIFDQVIEEEQVDRKIYKGSEVQSRFQSQKTQCYETLARCFELKKSLKNLKDLSLNIQEQFLEAINSPLNLQKILRLVLYPYLRQIQVEDASKYIDFVSLLSSFEQTPKSYNRAFQLIKGRLNENSLVTNFQNYIENFSSIYDFVNNSEVLKSWKSFEKSYERQTINDFISLNEELTCFLGDGYLTGVLREVLQENK